MYEHIFGRDLEITACSICGRRAENQDSLDWVVLRKRGNERTYQIPVGLPPDKEIFAAMVCDGMGGMDFGKEASKLVVDMTMDWLAETEYGSLETIIVDYRTDVLPSIEKELISRYPNSGTTLSMVLGVEGRWASLHLGDSRVYAIGKDGREFRTSDHSPVESLYRSGLITEDEMNTHHMKNLISMYVGGGFADRVEVNCLDDCSLIVICSDGAYGSMSWSEFFEIISEHDAAGIADEAYNRGSNDNISVIRIKAND